MYVSMYVCLCKYIDYRRDRLTYIHTLTACSQPINVFNPNRTSTLLDLHSLIHPYIHPHTKHNTI